MPFNIPVGDSVLTPETVGPALEGIRNKQQIALALELGKLQQAAAYHRGMVEAQLERAKAAANHNEILSKEAQQKWAEHLAKQNLPPKYHGQVATVDAQGNPVWELQDEYGRAIRTVPRQPATRATSEKPENIKTTIDELRRLNAGILKDHMNSGGLAELQAVDPEAAKMYQANSAKINTLTSQLPGMSQFSGGVGSMAGDVGALAASAGKNPVSVAASEPGHQSLGAPSDVALQHGGGLDETEGNPNMEDEDPSFEPTNEWR